MLNRDTLRHVIVLFMHLLFMLELRGEVYNLGKPPRASGPRLMNDSE